MAKQMFCRRAGSVAYGPRMPGPPLPMTTVVRLDAHSLASALIVRDGTPQIGAAHSGVWIPAPVQQIHGAVEPSFERERSGDMRNLRIRAELQVRAVHTRRGFGRRYLALIANRHVDHSGF